MRTIKTLEQFNKLINENKYVLVNFCAEWRTSCRTMLPILKKLSENNTGRILVIKIEVSDLPESAIQFDVLGLPDLYLLRAGIVFEKLSGHLSLELLQAKVDELLSKKFHNIPPRGH